MKLHTIIALHVLVLLVFSSVYYYIAMVDDDPEDQPHPLKSLYHGASVHFPFCYNDFGTKNYIGRCAVLCHNITVQILLISTGAYGALLLAAA
jgi:hypothetical protein